MQRLRAIVKQVIFAEPTEGAAAGSKALQNASAPAQNALQEAGIKGPELDYDNIRKKYTDFRNARLREDAGEQFSSEIEGVRGGVYTKNPFTGELDKGDYTKYSHSAKANQGVGRAPLNDTVDVLVIGSGFSGLFSAARTKELWPEARVRIVEKGSDVGGTWYWNRYPGVACDVPSYDYLPLLDEIDYIPQRRYSGGAEIYAHTQRITDKYDLYPLAVFNTTVTETTWDDASGMWILKTDRGDSMKGKYCVVANGTLSKPKLPAYLLKQLEAFQGESFHSSRWNYDITGPNLEKLAGKRVGIVGTGASAVQAIPECAKTAGHLFIFQRTPSSIEIRGDFATDPNWARKQKPGWQGKRRQRVIDILGKADGPGFLAMGKEERAKRATQSAEDKAKRAEELNMKAMRKIHERIEQIVKDPATAESLKPYYMIGCKRPTFHDEFLPAFNQPNVTLVDTLGKGIEQVGPKGPVFNGKEYELDILIMATGFEVQLTGIYNHLVGKGGVDLQDKYAKAGISTCFGMHSNGYPNMFVMGGYQASFSFNLSDILGRQGAHVAKCIDYARKNMPRGVMQVKQAQEDEWVQDVIRLGGRSNYSENCTPGYYNFEASKDRPRQNRNWQGSMVKYYNVLDEAEGNLGNFFEAS